MKVNAFAADEPKGKLKPYSYELGSPEELIVFLFDCFL